MNRSPSVIAFALLLVGCAPTPTSVAIAPTPRVAPPPLLLPTAPGQYTVQLNDHEWGVADRFTDQPWRWKELWASRTPLYPGDTIEVLPAKGDGTTPRLRLAALSDRPIIKVSPQVRTQPLDQPIPTIPRAALRSFLRDGLVVEDDDWAETPYLLATDDGRLTFDSGATVYARSPEGAVSFRDETYQVFRPGETFRDLESGDSLGQQLLYLADAKFVRFDEEREVAVLTLGTTMQPLQPGDRLLVLPDENELINFTPEAVTDGTQGRVIAHLDGKTLGGRFDNVVLDLGAERVNVGSVLRIDTPNAAVRDPVTNEQVELPSRRSGLVMVYRVFDQVSYALVMEAQRPVRKADRVSSL